MSAVDAVSKQGIKQNCYSGYVWFNKFNSTVSEVESEMLKRSPNNQKLFVKQVKWSEPPKERK